MGAHLDRAWVLFGQSRYDLAEGELRQELAADPDCAVAHALLAICLAERDQLQEATREAEAAVLRDPEFSFCHYALARVLNERNHYGEAERAIREAIRLDPYNASYCGHQALVLYNQRRWQDALDAAERGLAIEPEEDTCTNLRAMALVKLGRREEAGRTIHGALARDPENAFTHANQGWALLHEGEHKKALDHFREALRLDPTLEIARAGIVEALKARWLVYRVMLRFFLWMGRLSGRAQWAVILGGYLGYRGLRALADARPEYAPFIWPVLAAYIVFALLTWLADPLFNLTLRLNRFGRLALSPDQLAASNWVGLSLLAGLATLVAWLVTGRFEMLLGALAFGLLALPVAGTYKCHKGWPRNVMAGYATVLAALAVAAVALFGLGAGPPGRAASLLGLGCLVVYFPAAWVSQWVAVGLMQVVPRR